MVLRKKCIQPVVFSSAICITEIEALELKRFLAAKAQSRHLNTMHTSRGNMPPIHPTLACLTYLIPFSWLMSKLGASPGVYKRTCYSSLLAVLY